MKYILFLSLPTFFTLALIFGIPRAIKIKSIECQSQFGKCSDQISNELANRKGQRLTESKRQIEDLLKANTSIEKYSVRFMLPDKLQVSVIESSPKYSLTGKDASYFDLINDRGEVVSIVESTTLPTLLVDTNIPNLGESVDEKILFALQILSGVYITNTIQKAYIESDSLIVELKDNPKVIFPLSGDKDVLLGSMVLILSRLKDESEDFRIENAGRVSEIDLRFKNPVLR